MFDQSTVEYLKWGTTQLLYIPANLISVSLIAIERDKYYENKPINSINLLNGFVLKMASWGIQYLYHSGASASGDQQANQIQKFTCEYSPVLYSFTQLAQIFLEKDMQTMIQPIDAGNANFFFARLAGKCHSDELDSND